MPLKKIEPGQGQESVWDYPRPPRMEPTDSLVKAVKHDVTVAESRGCFRILETSHPPVFYFPPSSVRTDLLREASGGSFCEWKGHAYYFSLEIEGRTTENVAWTYPSPTDRFAPLAGFLAFYPSKMDACYVDAERVRSQEGDFYGGWITDKIVGPFKGGPGTLGW